jgi:hypothetical protein
VLSTHFRRPRGLTMEEMHDVERHARSAALTIEQLCRA